MWRNELILKLDCCWVRIIAIRRMEVCIQDDVYCLHTCILGIHLYIYMFTSSSTHLEAEFGELMQPCLTSRSLRVSRVLSKIVRIFVSSYRSPSSGVLVCVNIQLLLRRRPFMHKDMHH